MTSHHITSHHINSHHITSRDVMPYQISPGLVYEEVLHYHPDQANRLPPLAGTSSSRSSPYPTPGAHVQASRTTQSGGREEGEDEEEGRTAAAAAAAATTAKSKAAAAAAAVAVAAAAAEASLGKKRARDAWENGAVVVERGLDQPTSSAPYSSRGAHAIPAGAALKGDNDPQAQQQQQQQQQQQLQMQTQKRYKQVDGWSSGQTCGQTALHTGVPAQELVARAPPARALGSVREEEEYEDHEVGGGRSDRGMATVLSAYLLYLHRRPPFLTLLLLLLLLVLPPPLLRLLRPQLRLRAVRKHAWRSGRGLRGAFSSSSSSSSSSTGSCCERV